MSLYDFARIKRLASVEQVANHYGAQIVRDGERHKLLCIFHTENTPSMMFYPDGHFHCYGCQKQGDLVDVVQHLEGYATERQAIEKLAAICGIDEGEYVNPQDVQLPTSFRKFNRGSFPSSVTNPGSISTVRIPLPSPEPKWPHPTKEQIEYGPWTHVKDYPYYEPDGSSIRYYIERIERYPKNGEGKKEKRFLHKWRHEDGSWVYGIKAGLYVKRPTGEYRQFDAKRDREQDAIELPEVKRVLYNAPNVVASDTVYLVEGEKDADTLLILGLPATTPSGGANSVWLPEFTELLAGKTVIHIPDNEPERVNRKGEVVPGPGKQFAERVKAEIESHVVYRQIVSLGEHKDITEYLEAKTEDPDIRREALAELLESPEQKQFEARQRAAEQARIEAEVKEAGFLAPVTIVSLFQGGEEAFLDYTLRPPGIPTGFAKFDEMTQGLYGGTLNILAARPAMGKTALALNIALNVARDQRTVTVSSLEMTSVSLLERLLCNIASVDSLSFRSGRLDPADRHRLAKAWRHIQSLPLFIDDHATVNIDYLYEKYLRLKKEQDLGLAVIDYLQLMQGDPKKPFENRVQEISSMTRGLKLMAKELDIPFLVLCQLSREPDKRTGDHRPILSDLRESGTIEQDADLVSFIFREEVYRPDKLELHGKAEFIIGKQRNGDIGRTYLRFRKEFTRFEDTTDFDSSNMQEQYAEAPPDE